MSETDQVSNNQNQEISNVPKPVYVTGIWSAILAIYLILVTASLLFALIALWSSTEMSGGSFLSLSDEATLLLIVVISGALGSMVHALRSFFWYVGNRRLMRSWVLQYIMLPFVGSTLGVIFYITLRAGLFSPTADVDATSPFGFSAVAGLVGMFSAEAVKKLKEVASTLFSKAEVGKDHVKPEDKDDECDDEKEGDT